MRGFMKTFLSAFIFVAMFTSGFYFFNLHKDDFPSVGRDPAAVQGSYDLSNLSGETLAVAVRNRLLKGMDVQKTTELVSIEVGNFVFTTTQGTRKFACEEFDKIAVSFVAEGASVAGEKPFMTLKGKCQNDIDLSRILPMQVPLAVFAMETPADGEFQTSGPLSVEVSLKHMPDHWPKTWVLHSVELFKSQNTEKLVVNQSDVTQILGRPVVLTF